MNPTGRVCKIIFLSITLIAMEGTALWSQQTGNERFIRSRFSFVFGAGTSIAPKPEIESLGRPNEYPLMYSASNSPMQSLLFGYRSKNKVDYYLGIDFIEKAYSASTILPPINGWSEHITYIEPRDIEVFRCFSLGIGKSILSANDFDLKFLYALGFKLASSSSRSKLISKQGDQEFIWIQENHTSPSSILHSIKVMPTWHFKLVDIGLITGIQYFHQPPIYGAFTLLPSQANSSSYSVSMSRWQFPLQINIGKRL